MINYYYYYSKYYFMNIVPHSYDVGKIESTIYCNVNVCVK